MKTLHFTIDIAAPARTVWDTMLQPDSYREWTAEFSPGSTYEGSWEQGARIRFLSPSGDGIFSRIAVNRPHAFVSIEHLGEIQGGVDQPTSSWAGAFENYTLTEQAGGTRVQVDMDTTPDFESYMQDAWPRALAKLKTIVERD
jgi:uncharacterized protein YndB with AHSA1/START domain